jgi:hypothetical protein
LRRILSTHLGGKSRGESDQLFIGLGPSQFAPQLIDAETSKRFWNSPTGWDILTFIATILMFLCQEYRLDTRGANGEKLIREIVQQVQEFWLVHKDQPAPNSKVDARGDG